MRLIPASYLAAMMCAMFVVASNSLAEPTFDVKFPQERLEPFLATYCSDCHTGDSAEGGIKFDDLPAADEFVKTREKWLKVSGQLHGRGMPPADSDQPSEDDRIAIVDWLNVAADYVDCQSIQNPGRVTIHRLNRNEYDNTVHDLFAIDFHPGESFPADDVGAGFDNIADVLSMSPLLLEKYLEAARQVAERTIVLPKTYKPLDRTIQAESMRSTSKGGTVGDGTVQKMSTNGELYTVVRFPVEGEYELVFRAYGDQAGPDPVKAELLINGERQGKFQITAEHDSPEEYGAKLHVPEGRHRVAVSFTNDYLNKSEDPKKSGDRNMAVDYLKIKGPLSVTKNATPESHERVFFRPIQKGSKEEDLRAVLERLATRCYRRPASTEEVDRLRKLVAIAEENGEPVERGVQLALQAILVSPYFLFRIELDEPTDQTTGVRTLDGFELATRLSYFLWSSTPDEELFTAAQEGKLSDEQSLREQMDRMLDDEKIMRLVTNFSGQWLQLRNLDLRTPDKDRFPSFNEDLRRSMLRETELFFAFVLRENRSVLEFLEADYTYVNQILAEHYGLPGVEGTEFQRIELGEQPRGGLLTQASVLTMTSDPTRTSPVKRGKWVMEALLGTPPPAPPPNVPELESQRELHGTLRQRMEQHRANPACAVCHEQMDTIGFGLENFDAIGQWRDNEGDFEIDASGKLPDGSEFRGPKELSRALTSKKDLFVRSLVEKMLTYALGRQLEYYDRCAVDEIMKGVSADGYRFRTLIWEVIRSEPFRMRQVAPKGSS